ncbi:hypothetical protein Egran_00939 [Elaphomyces granulatus]|uniref:Uncharacterized protein n=1 Tax=Elaphomyces granulatus TaxID=519963 RepID=A0A232M4E1_9EURO|nr:hypothetical protein Egran_00939 [Elaphomyces granulatus]
MLTPIKVRGRRKRPIPQQKKSGNDAGPNHVQPRPKGRPMLSFAAKRASQEKAITRKQLRAAEAIQRSKRQRKLSQLECLPVELIEKIFLYALDVNLPRASPSLAAALSSERIYRILILLAFWDDPPRANDTSTVEIAKAFQPLDYIPLEDEERRRLQCSILLCRWCTVRRIQALLPDLMRLTLQKHWFGAGFTMDCSQQEALGRLLKREEDIRTFGGTGADYEFCILSIVPLVRVSIESIDFMPPCFKAFNVLGIKTFPDKLIRGSDGFTDDDVASLELFRHAYGFGAFGASGADVSFSRDALQQGIHAALVEKNAAALLILLKIDEYFTRGHMIANAAGSQHYYSLPAEHFHTAIRVSRLDPTFFQLLLRTNAESVPADDSIITQWAMELDHALGPWLLDFMLLLPQSIRAAREDPRQFALFYFGRANLNTEIGRRYLDEVLKVRYLPSWMEEVSHDVSLSWCRGVRRCDESRDKQI